MVTAAIEKSDIKTLHESIFWTEDDPRFKFIKPENVTLPKHRIRDCLAVDMSQDSYIWVFAGPRGAGKSLAMTYYAALAKYENDFRLVSNYPISFILNRINGTSIKCESEPLDLYKLLCFDDEYQNCLFVIDEAPDVISHMAAMTWKNRLIATFTRQIRKSRNSLFLGSQQYAWIDKSMRWQTDIVVRCQDAFRKYGGSQGLDRGACILLDFYDNSGQWTGKAKNIEYDGQLEMIEADDSIELPGKPIWGVYDTLFKQDIFETLRRVEMKLDTYEIKDNRKSEESVNQLKDLMPKILIHTGAKIRSSTFYRELGELNQTTKTLLGSLLNECGVKTNLGNTYKNFTNFDPVMFRNKVMEL